MVTFHPKRHDSSQNEDTNQRILFKDRIKVERSITDSAQAKIFFGREIDMDIPVVLKQYQGVTFNQIIREIKIFTLIERDKMRASERKEKVPMRFIVKETGHDSLPQLLGYKVQEGIGEILLLNNGPSLEKWQLKILGQERKHQFALQMVS